MNEAVVKVSVLEGVIALAPNKLKSSQTLKHYLSLSSQWSKKKEQPQHTRW